MGLALWALRRTSSLRLTTTGASSLRTLTCRLGTRISLGARPTCSTCSPARPSPRSRHSVKKKKLHFSRNKIDALLEKKKKKNFISPAKRKTRYWKKKKKK